MKLLLGVTGCISAKKIYEIQKFLKSEGHDVKTVYTQNSFMFLDSDRLSVGEYSDDNQKSYFKRNKTLLHIDLADWAETFIIIPCNVDTLAKISYGFGDNLLTSCARAWDTKKPLFVSLEINENENDSPLTENHKDSLYKRGIFVKRNMEISKILKELLDFYTKKE